MTFQDAITQVSKFNSLEMAVTAMYGGMNAGYVLLGDDNLYWMTKSYRVAVWLRERGYEIVA